MCIKRTGADKKKKVADLKKKKKLGSLAKEFQTDTFIFSSKCKHSRHCSIIFSVN